MWYKNAIFYQALVPAFYDGAGRGTGTISGVTAKLDYLQWLGVDCIWLPPFFSFASARRRLRCCRLPIDSSRLRHHG